MRIPSDQFDTIDVSEVTWYGGVNSDKLEQQSSSAVASSLFSAFQLKLPQFRIRSPNGPSGSSSSSSTNGGADCCESSESNPTSPVLTRHGSERRKQTLAHPPLQKFSHQTLSRHQSLSANNTPVRLVELVVYSWRCGGGELEEEEFLLFFLYKKPKMLNVLFVFFFVFFVCFP